MPEISRFLGIIIYMYLKDHEPPHFHAHYQGFRSVWSIEDGILIAGSLPPRIARLVKQWTKEHQQELMDNWELRAQNETPKRIDPL